MTDDDGSEYISDFVVHDRDNGEDEHVVGRLFRMDLYHFDGPVGTRDNHFYYTLELENGWGMVKAQAIENGSKGCVLFGAMTSEFGNCRNINRGKRNRGIINFCLWRPWP